MGLLALIHGDIPTTTCGRKPHFTKGASDDQSPSHTNVKSQAGLTRGIHGVVDIDARDLLVLMFMPGSLPESPSAEESSEYPLS